MKFTKLSLIAILAVSSALAGESTISGDAKVFYGTDDAGEQDLFNKNGAYGNAAVSLDYSKEIATNISLNAGITGISTLGLENTLVSGVWAGAGKTGLNDTVWIDVANITAKFGNTTAVIGRQKLDTPLAFTETWNIVENTFDAFTFVNSDIKDTTLVASVVTRANGFVNFTNVQGGMTDLDEAIYAFGASTKLIPNVTAQAWYYNSAGGNNALWTQADATINGGITLGAQYGKIMAEEGEDSSILSAKVGYEANKMSFYAAYSQADEDGQSDFTNAAGYGGSPVYTEAWWNFGYVTNPNAQAIALGASYDLGSVALGAQYTTVTNDTSAFYEMDEITLTADTTLAGVDTSFALVNTSTENEASDGNSVQVYLTVPFSL